MRHKTLRLLLDSQSWKIFSNYLFLKKHYIVLGSTAILLGGMFLPLPPGAIAASIAPAVEMSQANQTPSLPPPLANQLRQDLGKRTGIAPGKLRIVETTSRTWPDGCLGLARPDEMCSQAMVEGWRVVVTDGNRRWVYRTDRSGRTFRLETPTKPKQ